MGVNPSCCSAENKDENDMSVDFVQRIPTNKPASLPSGKIKIRGLTQGMPVIKDTQKLTGCIRAVDDVNFLGPSLDYSMQSQQSNTLHPVVECLAPSHLSLNSIKQQPKGGQLAIKTSDFVETVDFRRFPLDYSLNEKIGEGSYGRVHRAVHTGTGAHRAVKVMKLEGSNNSIEQCQRGARMALNELVVLKDLDHPNIVRVLEAYRDEKNFAIVTELCQGNDLFHEIIRRKQLPEQMVATVFRQLLLAVNYLHQRNIAHRDIKAENVLIRVKEDQDIHVKLLDFGLACHFNPQQGMLRVAGTRIYMAPEMLTQAEPYTTQADMWSLGILLYIMLTGCVPFVERDANKLSKMIIAGQIDAAPIRVINPSVQARKLLAGLFQLDPKKRLSAREALQHPFITQQMAPVNVFFPLKQYQTRLHRMAKFKVEFQLQVICLTYLAHKRSHEDDEAAKLFTHIDDSGALKHHNLARVMDQFEGLQLDQVFQKADLNNNGKIDYTEFLISSQDCSQIPDEQIRMAFQYFDQDQNGGISAADLKQSLGRNHPLESDRYWKQIVNEVTKGDDEDISFGLFSLMMGRLSQRKKHHFSSNETAKWRK